MPSAWAGYRLRLDGYIGFPRYRGLSPDRDCGVDIRSRVSTAYIPLVRGYGPTRLQVRIFYDALQCACRSS